MITKNKRLVTILVVIACLLSLPLIAMMITGEVKWTLFDFIVAGGLLTGTGLLCEWVLRKVKKPEYRITLCLSLLVLLILVWVELAVGIFGTPFAGQ
jgi:bacteriorhodopsin